ncbi:MAG: hypothetical protein K2L87_01265 [Clostridiales bacterium]|nr:hypothetical protein [Clostridiales bacterium]
MVEIDEEMKQEETGRAKNKSDFLDKSIVVMIVGLFIAIIITFLVDFIFNPEIDWKEVGVDTAIVSACTIAIYLLLRSYMQRKGRKTDDWKEAKGRLNDKGKEVLQKDFAQYMAEYCRDWEDKRLDEDRKAILSVIGITLEDFKEKYIQYNVKELRGKYPDLTKSQLDIIRTAQRTRRLHYDERYLYVHAEKRRGRHASPSSGISTDTLNKLTTARIIITSLCTSLFTASFLREIIFNFSTEAIVRCVIKIAVIVFFGTLGMIGGYNFSAVKEVREMHAKADDLETFIKWCEKNKGTAEVPAI